MVRLGVNVDLFAVIRNERRSKEPDPVAAAMLVEMSGADGVVVTLQEDRRYVTDRDVDLLKEVITTHFNLRLNASEEMIKKAVAVLPDMVTLLPVIESGETVGESVDIVSTSEFYQDAIATLRASNIVVCAKIEPDLPQVKAAARAGADYVEFNTQLLAEAQDLNTQTEELEKLRTVAIAANKLGLGVSAGKGLNYTNIREVATISQIEEVNVGFALVCRSLMVGLERAVRDMHALLRDVKSTET